MSESESKTQSPAEAVLEVATDLAERGVAWDVFYQQVFGLGGAVRTAFPTAAGRRLFEMTPECLRIHGMLQRLMRRKKPERDEPQSSVITVRLPRAMHQALLAEARERGMSMNRLAIERLMQLAAEEKAEGEAV